MSINDDLTLPLDDSQRGAPGTPEVRDQWGPFRLLARVGSGGFGEVYRAWDPNLEREVALKLLLPGVAGGDQEYTAMLREARAMASVQHPNIVHVYGIDRHDGRVGFWTDFVKGKTLSALLGQQGPFGYREAALIGIDISRALSAVHRAGLLHRDIKAENVMREQGGRILLMDFGLSAAQRNLGNQLAGTPNYMAPELFEGQKATVCTDIYAVGVLLYYLVIAEYPARLTGLSASEAKAALQNRIPLMDVRSDLPEAFLRTVRTAMELDPAKRFSSAGQLAEALGESLGTMPVAAGPMGGVPYTPVNAPTMGTATFGNTPTAGYTPTASYGPVQGYTTPQGYTPTQGYTTPQGYATPRPVTPPPPPPAPKVKPQWGNLFGLLAAGRLSKRGRWALLALAIFTAQKWWRADDHRASRHKTQVTQTTDESDSSDDEKPSKPNNSGLPDDVYGKFLKAEDLLSKSYKSDNVTQAVETLKDVVDDQPKYAPAHVALANAYLREYRVSMDNEHLEQAKSAASKAVEIDPHGAAPAYAVLSEVYSAQKDYDAAMQQAQKAIAANAKDAAGYGALSQIYLMRGDHDEALKAAKKAAALAPDQPMYAQRLGRIYYLSGDAKAARSMWQKSVEADAENAGAYVDLARADEELDHLSEAEQDLQKAVVVDPTVTGYAELSKVQVLEGKFADAVQSAQKAVDTNGNDWRGWAALGRAQQWSDGGRDKAPHSYAKAIKLAEAKRAKTPDDAELLAELALLYGYTHDPGHGVPLVTRAVQLAPDDPRVGYAAGVAYELLGIRPKAVELLAPLVSHGVHATEFQRSPELAALRSDPVFQVGLQGAKRKKITVKTMTIDTGPYGPKITVPVPPEAPHIPVHVNVSPPSPPSAASPRAPRE